MRRALAGFFGFAVAISIAGMAAPASAAPFTLRNYKNEQYCLGASGGNMTPGTNLIIWTCNGHTDQSWDVSSFASGYYELFDEAAPPPPDSGSRCAALSGGSETNGTQVVISPCIPGTVDSAWAFSYRLTDAGGHNCYSIISMGINKVIGPSNGQMVNGVNVILWPDLNHSDQLWCVY